MSSPQQAIHLSANLAFERKVPALSEVIGLYSDNKVKLHKEYPDYFITKSVCIVLNFAFFLITCIHTHTSRKVCVQYEHNFRKLLLPQGKY